MTPAAALALWRKAEASHKRADWRLACRALGAIVEAHEAKPAAEPMKAPEPPTARPLSLIEFLCTLGGVRDDGGELRAMDPDLNEYARIKRRRGPNGRLLPKLIQPAGLSLATATERAWDAGYFPAYPMPQQWQDTEDLRMPDSEDLLAAIDRELRQTARDEIDDDDPGFDPWQDRLEHPEAWT